MVTELLTNSISVARTRPVSGQSRESASDTMKKQSLGTRATTLQDVASKAGVGVSTASYVLNNKPKAIGAQTRERVWRAARDLNYRPNMAARSLVTRQTHIVALWIPNVATAFAARVIAQIQNQASRDGYEVMICDTERTIGAAHSGADLDAIAPALQMPLWNVDGIITFFGSSSKIISSDPQSRSSTPMVSMGAFSTENTDFVELSLAQASRQAVQWLMATGRQQIGFLVPLDADFAGDERREAYLAMMREAGKTPIVIHMKNNSRAAACEATQQYLQSHAPLDGLFCYNDYAAIGAGRALREAGLQVPAQISLTGCDGIEDGDYLSWPLHTIELPIEAMCAIAWEFFKNRLKNADLPLQQKNFEGIFKIREN